MGISSDGILFYGIPFDDGTEMPWESGDSYQDCEDWLAEVFCGIAHPSAPYPEVREVWDGKRHKPERALTAAEEQAKKTYQEYWRAKHKAVAGLPFEFRIHCSFDYPMHYITVKQYTNSRGYATEIESWELPDNADEILRDVCEKAELPFSQPKWWLVSLYG
jgi:hypothetical protein